jgi:hypothetical protein
MGEPWTTSELMKDWVLRLALDPLNAGCLTCGFCYDPSSGRDCAGYYNLARESDGYLVSCDLQPFLSSVRINCGVWTG